MLKILHPKHIHPCPCIKQRPLETQMFQQVHVRNERISSRRQDDGQQRRIFHSGREDSTQTCSVHGFNKIPEEARLTESLASPTVSFPQVGLGIYLPENNIYGRPQSLQQGKIQLVYSCFSLLTSTGQYYFNVEMDAEHLQSCISSRTSPLPIFTHYQLKQYFALLEVQYI